jgi:exodeoxyribonuclease X
MKVFVLDTETTGFDQPEVIEVGMLNFHTDEEFHWRFRPSKPISLGAMAVHHIMDEDLIDCPPSSMFRLPDDTAYLIGHNIFFDWEAIGKPNVKLIDTLLLAREVWPEVESHSLGALMYYLFRPDARDFLRKAHSAVADCNMAYMILAQLVTVLKANNTIENEETMFDTLVALTQTARVPGYIDFGKHKDKRYLDVPEDYKAWYYRQADPDPLVVEAMKNPRRYDIMGRELPRKVR